MPYFDQRWGKNINAHLPQSGPESLGSCPGTKKHFSVYITESQPDLSGKKMAKAFCHLTVPFTVVPDAAVGYIMDKVDLVIVGAEGVVENRGIINKVGASVLRRALPTVWSSTDDLRHPTTSCITLHSSNPV